MKVLALVLATAALVSTTGAAAQTTSFHGTISRIDAAQAKRMTGVSWRPGCPVALGDLRLLRLSHRGFDGRVRTGRLVVHRDVAREVVAVFRRLYEAGFRVRRMVAVDAYGASDFRSIEADNTSAFNCRYVEGTRRWSEHAYGRALDLNPIENPYVSGGHTSHRASVPYLDRSRRRPGMAYEGGAAVRAFDAIGWGWGGRWSAVKDYQHFSARGASATGHAGRQRSFWACPVGHTPVEGRFTCRRLRLVKAREGRCCTASSDHRPRGRVGGRRGSWAL